MINLNGKIAFVTGAAQGIGRSIAKELGKAGAEVVVTDINHDEGQKTADQLSIDGIISLFIPLDVTKEEQWESAMAEAKEKLGGIDILVNNAGMFLYNSISQTSLIDWKKVFSVNVESVFLGTKVASRYIKERSSGNKESGSIINISSIAGLVGGTNAAAYHASKGAVRLFTKSSALEFSDPEFNIRVNSIHPGVIETDMGDQVIEMLKEVTEMGGNEARSLLTEMHPMGKLGTPKDIANMVLFLASNESSFITGAEMVVDGGFVAK